jgi:hypothetical protein
MGSFFLEFFEFFWYQEFDEIFQKKKSKLVEVTLKGKQKINSQFFWSQKWQIVCEKNTEFYH